jgi:small conductance mechanosensitive channel
LRSDGGVAATIVTLDNRVVVMPNHQVRSSLIVRMTARDTRRVDLIFSISYDDDIGQEIQVLRATIAEHPPTLDESEPCC